MAPSFRGGPLSPARRTRAAPAGPAPALLRALRHLLRPLVRLLLGQQLTQPDLSALLKSVYLEMGEAELREGGEPPSASRLSLLTGVHRKDIRRLREEPAAGYAPPASISLGARLVARWTGSPRFVDGRGRPRALPRSSEGREPSFESLVASVSTDIRSRAVLDEWLRLGVVELDARDRVRLCRAAFVPARGFDEMAHYFGRNLHDHIAAAAHNLAAEGDPMLERSVYYDGLTAESVAELAALSEKLGMQALQSVNRRALVLQRRDAKRGGSLRMNFGTYFYRTETGADDAEDQGDA